MRKLPCMQYQTWVAKWEEVNEKRTYAWRRKLRICAKRQTNQRETDLFMKEIRILNELKCENVVKVEGFCSQPLAVMLEYLYFDFKPLCAQYLFRAGTLLLKLYLLQSFFEVNQVDQHNLH